MAESVVAIGTTGVPAVPEVPDVSDWDTVARRLGAQRVILARPVVPDWSLSAGRLQPRDQLYRRVLAEPELASAGVVDTSLLGDAGRRLRAAGIRALMVIDGPEPGTLLIAENPQPRAGGAAGPALVAALAPVAPRSAADVVAAWVEELTALPAQPLVSPAGATSLAHAAQVDLVVLLWPGPDGVEACWGGADCGQSHLSALSWPPPAADALAPELDGLTARPPVAPWRLVPARRGGLVVAVSPPPADVGAIELAADLLAFEAERARLSPEGRQHSLLEERVRIAGLVHDGVTQQVSNVLIQLQLLELASDDAARLRETLAAARVATACALEELRASIYELAPRPSALGDLVLSLRDWCRDYTAQWGIRVTVEVEGEDRPVDPEVSMLAYAVVQEGLTNVRKHAGAATAVVGVGFAPDHLRIAVRDDGHGFSEAQPEPTASGRRMGLRLLRDRVRSAGGTLGVVSRPGQGAEVAVRLPL